MLMYWFCTRGSRSRTCACSHSKYAMENLSTWVGSGVVVVSSKSIAAADINSRY